MTIGIVGSTVIIHLLRSNPLAIAWANSVHSRAGVTSITWLEVMYGAAGKAGQAKAEAILGKFDIHFPTQQVQQWAMEQLVKYRLSQGVAINDCLIASVAYQLQTPILTHNQKDFLKILPAQLVVKPY